MRPMALTCKAADIASPGGPQPPVQPPPAPVAGQAQISWTAPTANTDGSALQDLAGFRISYGTSATALTQTIQIADPGAKMFAIKDLASGTYFLSVRAFNAGGNESAMSSVVSKVVL